MLFGLFSLVVSFLTGWLIVLRAFPKADPSTKRSGLLLTLPLGLGLGLGVSSLVYFVWLCFFTKLTGGFIWADLIILAALSVPAALSFFRGKISLPERTTSYQKPISATGWVIGLCLVMTLIALVRAFYITSVESPQGDFDAWARWNRNARFIYRARTDWQKAYANLARFGHPDNHTSYPLLLPTLVARGWSYARNEAPAIPASIAFVFMSATAALLIASLGFFSSRSQGWLAGVVLLATPRFIKLATAQYADIPLAFFFLSAAVFLLQYRRRAAETDRSPAPLVLAGLSAGLACWTKNEGLLFLAGVVLCFFLSEAGKDRTKHALRQAAFFAAGALPAMLAVCYFRQMFAPGLHLFSQPISRPLLETLTDGDRILTIGEAFIGLFFTFGGWVISLTLLLGIYLIVAGIRPLPQDRQMLPRLGGLLIFMLAGYFMIYLLTPYDLQWHLATSLRRLFIQLWPLALFVYFLTVNQLPDKE